MFRRVLVPLDGSPDGEIVLEHLPAFLIPDAQTLLLHVLPELHLPTGASHDPWFAVQRGAEQYLADVPRGGWPGPLRTFVDTGEPGERILAVAASIRADLVALVTHTWKGVPRAGLGDVARRIIRRCPGAALVVPPKAPDRDRGLRVILVPLEGPGWSPADVEPVLPVAARHEAEVVFVHVDPPEIEAPIEGIPDAPLSIAAHDRRRRYQEAADYARSFGVRARGVFVHGDPAEQILAQAADLDADLVALGTRGREGLDRLIAGSVTETVLRSLDRPALVLRKAAILSRALNGVS